MADGKFKLGDKVTVAGRRAEVIAVIERRDEPEVLTLRVERAEHSPLYCRCGLPGCPAAAKGDKADGVDTTAG